jgi:hypothetical protein
MSQVHAQSQTVDAGALGGCRAAFSRCIHTGDGKFCIFRNGLLLDERVGVGRGTGTGSPGGKSSHRGERMRLDRAELLVEGVWYSIRLDQASPRWTSVRDEEENPSTPPSAHPHGMPARCALTHASSVLASGSQDPNNANKHLPSAVQLLEQQIDRRKATGQRFSKEPASIEDTFRSARRAPNEQVRRRCKTADSSTSPPLRMAEMAAKLRAVCFHGFCFCR